MLDSLAHFDVSRGAFSVVRLAIDERTKSQYACKMLRVSFLKQRGYWESTQREIEHMREMHHVGQKSCRARIKLTPWDPAESERIAGHIHERAIRLYDHGPVSQQNVTSTANTAEPGA